ncbi:1485_t:CDS:2 [Gigaspora margarita]|uniref:1485_t:CDS:1 n=1 Tax=Gigaspora margarita TaxID=4874 RepID=A0ABN7UT45_GIGMA|nr:1485_t:CDS:2 [Gigaspora margarita]
MDPANYENLKNKQESDNPLRVLKREQVEFILKAVYEDPVSGHLGERAIIDKIGKQYYWNQMVADIRNFIKGCDACQRQGKPKTKELLYPIKITQPFD